MYLSRPLTRRRTHKDRAERVHSPGIPADIAEGLAGLAEQARKVTRHTSPNSDAALARDLLNATLAALYERKVPIEALARAASINHQAVRRRVDSANPQDSIFTLIPESVEPNSPLGGRFHYLLTPTAASTGRFSIREIYGDPEDVGCPVLRTPKQAHDWLAQEKPSSLTPVRTSGEILLLVFAIDPGDLKDE
jgi:hypothetical protein